MIAERLRKPPARKPDDAAKDPPKVDRPAVRAAEQLIAGNPPEPGDTMAEIAYGPVLVPDDLFADVEDRAEAKLILTRALQSKRAVHVLLEGDPASGKSQLLQCVARLPHSRYAVGGMTTSSGMVDYLLERRSTQTLVIDEIDKAETSDFAALYSMMESGTVPRLQHGKTEVLRWQGRIFAACNDSSRLPEALRSRFVHVRLPSYTRDQAGEIMGRVLTRREGISAARAQEIAAAVSAHSRDPRDAVQVARLAGEDGELEPVLAQVIAKPPEVG